MNKVYPKIYFIYSYVYDSTLADLTGKKYNEDEQKEAARYIKNIDKEFSKNSDTVIRGISNISGLDWQKPLIDVYVSKYPPYSFSVPLTIKIYKNKKFGVAILVHELVHNILFQNQKLVNYKKLFKDFENENLSTKYHIIEGAILYKLNEKIFSDGFGGFFKYDDWRSEKSSKEYRRAIGIVIEKGPNNIIKRYIIQK